jgi:two-component system LytT family response regulator
MNQQTAPVTRCVIIDDEPASRQILKTHIEEQPWLRLVQVCENAIQGLECIQKSKPDIVFLDINMPEVSGLDLLEMMPSLGSSVIITSVHEKYAVDGYDYDIVSFLPKPVSSKRFLKAVFRAANKKRPLQNHLQTASASYPTLSLSSLEYPIQTPYFDHAFLWVKFDRRLFAIPYLDIFFIEGQHNYVAIHYKSNPIVRTRASISEISRGLPDFFIKTHRSYIVNRYQVKSIEGNTIRMQNDFKVSIAKDERSEIIISLTTGLRIRPEQP